MADVKGKMPFFISKTNPVTITGLTPDTSYNFQLVVYDNNENSTVWEDPITFKTLPATPVLNNFQLQLIQPMSEFAKGTFKAITTDSIQKAILNLDINNNKTYDFTLNSKIESMSYDHQEYPYYCLIYISDSNISTSNRYKLCISQNELKFVQYQSQTNYNVKITYDDSEMFYVIESDTIDGLLTQTPTTQISNLNVYLNHDTPYLLAQNQYKFDYFSSNYNTEFFIGTSDISTRTYYNYCSIDESGNGTIYIYNLSPETAYQITLNIYDSYNQSAKAGPVTIITKNIPPVITNVITESIKQHEITFYIECETSVGISSYTYIYDTESVTTQSNPYTIANLQTFTDYTFAITVTDINGQTDTITKTIKTSGTGPQISDLTISDITASSIIATVTATSQDAIDRYVWSCNNKVVQTQINSIEIENLDAYTNYTLNVVVYDVNNNYDTKSVDFTTKSTGIDVSTCNVTNISYTSFDVKLTTLQNIPINNIEIQLTNINDQSDVQTFNGFNELNFTVSNIYPNKTYSMKITITDIDNVSTVYNYPTNIVMKTAQTNISDIELSNLQPTSFDAKILFTSDLTVENLNLVVEDNENEVYNNTQSPTNNIFNVTNLNSDCYLNSTGSIYSGETSNVGINIEKINGNYYQYSTNGYQLFDASKLPTTSQGGATVTNNGDGSFTISGRGQLTENFLVGHSYNINDAIKLISKAGIYYLNSDINKNLIPYLIFGLYENGSPVNNKILISTGIFNINITDEDIQKIANGTYILAVYFAGSKNMSITTGTIKPIVYQDGDGTWEQFTGGQPSPSLEYPQEPEFVEIENLYSAGKNLFDNNKPISGRYGTGTPTETGVSVTGTYFCHYEIPVIPNTDYYISYIFSGNLNQISIYSDTKFSEENLIKKIHRSGGTFNSKDFTKIYLLFYCSSGSQNTSVYSDVMLNIGSTVQPYTPFVGEYQSLTSPLNLLALPNGVCDTWINGQITRNVGSVTFDSNSNWSTYGAATVDGMNIFYVDSTSSPIPLETLANKLICNALNPINPTNEFSISQLNTIRIGLGSSTVYVCVDSTEFATLNDWKAYLQSNPITVWYQLATPTTEQLALPILKSYYPFTNAWCDSIIQPQIDWKVLLNNKNTFQSQGEIYSDISNNSGIDVVEINGMYTQYSTNGYQLFDVSKLPTYSAGGATVTNNEDGSLTITGSGRLTSAFNIMVEDETIVNKIKKGQIFFDCGNITYPYCEFQLRGTDGVLFSLQNKNAIKTSFNITDNILSKITTSRMYLYGLSNETIKAGIIKPMLYQDGDGTWEQFTGGQPSPSPDYPQEPQFVEINKFESVGKNLFNINGNVNIQCNNGTQVSRNIVENGILTANSNTTIQNSVGQKFTNLNGKIISFSCNCLSIGTGLYGFIQIYDNGINVIKKQVDIGESKIENYTCKSDNIIIGFATGGGTGAQFTDIMINFGEIAQHYTPFVGKSTQQLSSPLNLMALPNGQYDIYKENKVLSNINMAIFSGKSSEKWIINSDNIFTINISNGTLLYPYNEVNILCDKLVGVSSNTALSAMETNQIKYGSTYGDTNIYIKVDTTNITNVTQFKSWLSSNPITIWYQLNNETAYDIKEDILQQLQSLHTYTGTTNVMCNAPVSFEYNSISIDKTENPILNTDEDFNITNLKFYGKSTQGSDPSPTNPQQITAISEVSVNINDGGTNQQTIQFTPPQPLYSTLDGSIADVVDVENGQYVYNMQKYAVTGNEAFHQNYQRPSGYYGRYFDLSSNTSDISFHVCCNYLPYVPGVWSKGQIGMCTNTTQVHLKFANETLGITDDTPLAEKQTAFTKYLKQLYASDNPLYVVVVVNKTTRPILPETFVIPTLKSFNSYTNITNDSYLQPNIIWNTLLCEGKIYNVTGNLIIENYSEMNKTKSIKAITSTNPVYVYFNTDGGTNVETIQSYPGNTIDLNKYTTKKDGYIFDGWYLNNELYTDGYVVQNSDITFIAKWSIKTFTVTFKYYGENATYNNKNLQTYTQQVDYGSTATPPELPDTSSTYQFVSWDKDFSSITQSITVNAQYTGVEYYISFQSEFGIIEGLNEDDVLIYNYGEEIQILPTISGISQSFQGWSTENGNPDNIITTSTIWTFTDVDILYAIFETYQLTYNYGEGIGYNTIQLLNANGFAYYNTTGNSATIQITDNNTITINAVTGTTHILRSLLTISSPTYGMICNATVDNNAFISIRISDNMTENLYDTNEVIPYNNSQNVYVDIIIDVPSSPGIYNVRNILISGLYEESPSYQYKTVGEPIGTLPITWSASKNNIGTWYDNQQGTNEILSSTIFNDATTIYALYKEREKISVLLDGRSFNNKLSTLISQATSIIFTNSKIPDDKISSATVVSISNSPYISYLYLDGNTIYIAPEEEGVTIYANIDCSMMFQYATTISTIIFDNFNTSHTESMSGMFGYSGITSINLSKLDTSNVNTMSQMFYSCYKLTSVDLSMLNTSNVTTMRNCFYENKVLTSVNLSNIDCSKLNDITSMFYGCVQLSSITFFTNNTTSLQNIGGVFALCSSLTNIDLSHLDTTNITIFNYAFRECTNLTSNIIIRNQNNPTYSDMLYNCSTNSNAQFVVNYVDDNTKTLAEQMVATKSSSSNVVLGTLQS